jgi:hypothetical protein
VHEGALALQYMREKMLEDAAGETVYIFGASPETSTPEWETFWREYHLKRTKQHIAIKIFYTKQTDPKILDWRNTMPNTEAKYLPFDTNLPAWFGGAGDHFEISIPGPEPLTFYIRSREAVLGFRAFFDYFWNQKAFSETGYDAFERGFNDMLRSLETGDTYMVIGANSIDATPRLQSFYESFHRRRIQKGVHVHMLASQDSVADIRSRFSRVGDTDGTLSMIKPFPSGMNQPFQINLCNGTAYIHIYSDPPTVITFHDPAVYIGFVSYFDALWGQESYVLRGPEAVRDLWLSSLETGSLQFIAARGYFVDMYPELFAEVTERAKTIPELEWRIINDPSTQGHALTTLPWVKTKYVLPVVPNPNVVWIFGNTVAVANWAESIPVIFVSTNPYLVQSYKDYFDTLWNQPELI